MSLTVADVARHLNGQVIGDGTLPLRSFAPADRAQAGDLTFAENENYFMRAEQSSASAVLIDGPFTSEKKVLIRVANARVGFAKVLALFFPEGAITPGVHTSAVVHPSAQIHPDAHVGPCCVIAERVTMGAGSALLGNNNIGAGCHIGENSRLYPNVTVYPGTEIGARVRIHSGTVIGSDGFGYVFDEGHHRKVPQIGTVIIRDDVEIGANVTIDRGALGPTIIGKGSKIDNLVQIAHNVIIGENCLLISQVGIAGSTRLGNHVILAGQVGVAGHLKIGNRVSVTAQSGLMSNIADGEKWMGSPAQPDRQAKRQLIALQRLPELLKRVADLEKKLGAPPETPATD